MSGTFRFVMEEPSESGKGQQKKRARLVTACDNCRNKKIKCLRSPASVVCESCKQSSLECTFADRDKYQAEKLGVSYSATSAAPYPTPWREGSAPEEGLGPHRRRSNSLARPAMENGVNGVSRISVDLPSVSSPGAGLNSPLSFESFAQGVSSMQTATPGGASSSGSGAASTGSGANLPTPESPVGQTALATPINPSSGSFNSLLHANRMFAPHHSTLPPNLQGLHNLQGNLLPGIAVQMDRLKQARRGRAGVKLEPGSGVGFRGGRDEYPPSEDEKGELKRISVPFFRYFGATANTPGYRRINVHTHTYEKAAPAVSAGGTTSRDSSPDVPRVSGAPVDGTSGSTNGQNGMNGSNGNGASIDPFTHAVRHPFHRPPLTMPPVFGAPLPPFPTGPHRSASPSLPVDNRPLFDPADDVPTMPHPDHLPHLAELFFDYLGCHFPFLDREEVMRDIKEKKITATLANCIAALGIRFTDRQVLLFQTDVEGLPTRRARAAEKYCMRAKEIITPYLSLPSVEIVQALVLIAWAEFGCGRDSGLWMYSRMAVGMAMDLGLGFEATIQLVTDHPERIRATWWAVILVDRINCWGTGRPIAIPDDAFDTEPPFVPPMQHGYNRSTPPPPGYVFGHLCRLVQLRGRMGDLINNTVKRKLNTSPVDLELTSLQYEMMAFYASLPNDLQFNLANFKLYFQASQGALFLLLHVMFHSVLIVLHRPQLLEDFTPDVPRASMPSVELSRSSARTIVDMVLLTDEQGPLALMGNPFVDLPILTAARSFLEDRKEFPIAQMPMNLIMSKKWPDSSIAKCKQFLAKMSKYWGGVMAVRRILEEQDMSPDGSFDLGRGESGDSQVAPPRPDSELIKQWATKQWRMHVTENRKSHRDNTEDGSNGPVSPSDSQKADMLRFGDSPEGASIGITGTLDTLLGMQDNSSMDALLQNDPANLLRVSFNQAEADFQFSNLPTQYYSIADPVDNFLQTLQGGGGMQLGPPDLQQPQPMNTQQQQSLQPPPQEQHPLMDVTMSDNTNGSFDTDAMLLFQNEIGRFFSIPEHLSRAPSPTLRSEQPGN
ncbi:hypothetical protein DACRYDRAFT_112461 [Dacryopinax primogenitus]|uniref:Zn(2)-C6 fungal-type domain-containing protein n=1 Tax=Dacryopinax primogenitus (strain DJM 731) TaxID=1858805 RepID=M5FUD7_DACPD|nr:uncharacterized protein DACRYDRAFT_112461 [Dacryopinax primogenitus]EJT96846.1 hypothetical protein DACRYDRAFT_112461 [Dacryopinax primogenitus]